MLRKVEPCKVECARDHHHPYQPLSEDIRVAHLAAPACRALASVGVQWCRLRGLR